MLLPRFFIHSTVVARNQAATQGIQSDKFTPLAPIEKKRLIGEYSDKIFNGTLLAGKIRQSLKERIAQKGSSYSAPVLGHIIVGDLAQSELYVKLKLKACDDVGIGNRGFKLPSDTSEEELLAKVRQL